MTKFTDKEIREFVPFKIAIRIRDVITFTLKSNGQCPELNISEDEAVAIENIQMDYIGHIHHHDVKANTGEKTKKTKKDPLKLRVYDYETVPVLKKFKIEILQKYL
jgi:hypothetical protein